MLKKLLFSMILIINCDSVQAVNHVDDQQKEVVKKLMKKVLRAQNSGKSDKFILDEIVTEVAAEFDDSGELISDKKSDTILIAGGIALGALALGLGGYLWYKHYRTKQQQNVYVVSSEDDVAVVESVPTMPVEIQPGEEIPVPVPSVPEYVLFHQEFRQLSVSQNQMIDVFLAAFPHDVRAPLREAIRNGNDANLINFINVAERAVIRDDFWARQNLEHIFLPAIERLTPHQQFSIILNSL